jgi:hypothetical protein
MALQLGWFHVDGDDPQVAIATDDGKTVVVLSETEKGGMTPGQLTFKHNVQDGTGPGQFSRG